MKQQFFQCLWVIIRQSGEATEAIRKLPRKDAAEVPIIAMTANAFTEDIQRSKNAGMNEHLTKPLDIEQLMKCLETWVGEKGN